MQVQNKQGMINIKIHYKQQETKAKESKIKVTKINESKQFMEGGLQEEPVDYRVPMSSPQLTGSRNLRQMSLVILCLKLILFPGRNIAI